MLMQLAVHFPLGRIGGEIADHGGLGSVIPELFERGSIVLHDQPRLSVFLTWRLPISN